MTRQFYRTIVSIDVLSEEPLPEGLTLWSLHDGVRDGPWSGGPLMFQVEPVDGPMMALLLMAQGSDPSFFMLTPSGEDCEDPDG